MPESLGHQACSLDLPGKVPWGNSELQSTGLEPPPVDGLRENPAAQNSSKFCTVTYTYTSCTNHNSAEVPWNPSTLIEDQHEDWHEDHYEDQYEDQHRSGMINDDQQDQIKAKMPHFCQTGVGWTLHFLIHPREDCWEMTSMPCSRFRYPCMPGYPWSYSWVNSLPPSQEVGVLPNACSRTPAGSSSSEASASWRLHHTHPWDSGP